jgi:hypothetical protein
MGPEEAVDNRSIKLGSTGTRAARRREKNALIL